MRSAARAAGSEATFARRAATAAGPAATADATARETAALVGLEALGKTVAAATDALPPLPGAGDVATHSFLCFFHAFF